MASGTATLDFGAFPGASHATVDVTGQAGLTSSSRLEAYVEPAATADHSVDEHIVESLKVVAVFKVNGEFTIHGLNANPLTEQPPGERLPRYGGGRGTRLYGRWTVGWAWT